MVKDVQTRWVETGAWWDGPAARALRGETADEERDLLAEEEVWRVVAGQGRAGHQGVYELSQHAWGTGQWRLRTVMQAVRAPLSLAGPLLSRPLSSSPPPSSHPGSPGPGLSSRSPGSRSSLRLDLHRARDTLVEAELSCRPSDRFLTAHLSALRVAATVLAIGPAPARAAGHGTPGWCWPRWLPSSVNGPPSSLPPEGNAKPSAPERPPSSRSERPTT